MREAAAKEGKTDRMQLWAGQAAKLGRSVPANQLANDLWKEAQQLLAPKQ